MRFIKYLLAILSLIYTAYSNEYDFKNYTVVDGLSESTINVIFEDDKGFLYIGTENGLGLFDGLTFFNYKMNVFNETTIFGNNIKSICQDDYGDIWVGTELGLSKLDTRTRKFERITNTKYNLKDIEKIFNDKNGDIWFKNSDGIYKYEQAFNEVECISCGDNLEINSFSNIYSTHSNEILISTFSNLYRYDFDSDTLRSMLNSNHSTIEISFVTDIIEIDNTLWIGSKNGLIKLPYDPKLEPQIYKEKTSSLVNDDIRDIEYSKKKNEIWISTKNGISILNLNSNSFKNIQVTLFANSIVENDIKNLILADKSNRVWFTTNNYGGINNISFIPNEKNSLDTIYVNLLHDETDQTSIPGNNITTFIEDKAGNVWFGTANAGLSMNSNFSSKFSSVKYDSENDWGLLRSKIYAIESAEDNFLWVATDHGLEYLSVEGIRYDHFPKSELGTSQITDIHFQNNNSLWVGSTNGLLNIDIEKRTIDRYNAKTKNKKRKIADNVVFDIYFDDDNYAWISTRKGVSILSLQDESIINYSMPSPIRFVFKDTYKNIWFTTISNGVYKAQQSQTRSIFNNQKIRFEHHKFDKEEKNGISSSKITSYLQSDDKFIWFGTTNGGLNKLDIKSNKFHHLFIEDGLPSNYITAIEKSKDGNLWISSKNGISLINSQTNGVLNFNLLDGISDLDFFRGSVSKNDMGKLFFGGPNGITIITPDDIKLNEYKPPCLITNVKKIYFDGSIENNYLNIDTNDRSNGLEINHKVKSITINFVALNYNQSKKNKYKYILEGFDNNWTEMENRRSVTFNNLERGNYVFKVAGSNNDNLWSETSSLSLSFVPHPLKSYTAFFIYFILSFFSIYRLVVFKNKQDQDKKEFEAHKKELEQARDFQLSLIPDSPPKDIAYDVHSYMKTSMEVGGDYYDYFKNDDDLFIVCGDATGHGLNAGMMVSITKAGLYGLELDQPNESLVKLNQAIKAIDLGKMRMSLNIAKFQDSKVTLSSAGMPPAYYFDSQKNEIEEILVPGLPLGSVKNADYDWVNFEMNQGDVLVLISDGLPECDNYSGEMLDYEAVKNCIHENGEKSSKEILDQLIRLGDNWMNEKMNEDDITIVVIKKI